MFVVSEGEADEHELEWWINLILDSSSHLCK